MLFSPVLYNRTHSKTGWKSLVFRKKVEKAVENIADQKYKNQRQLQSQKALNLGIMRSMIPVQSKAPPVDWPFADAVL